MRPASTAARRLAPPAVLTVVLIQGCCAELSAPPPPPPPLRPVAVGSAADPGPHNILSAVVRAVLENADSARIRFGVAGRRVTPVIYTLFADLAHWRRRRVSAPLATPAPAGAPLSPKG